LVNIINICFTKYINDINVIISFFIVININNIIITIYINIIIVIIIFF